MISNKIKGLFNFIDFLHLIIDNFKQFDDTIKEINELDKIKKNLSPRKNYQDKLKYDEVQLKIKTKYQVIDENIIKVIKSKVVELNICDWEKTKTIWDYNISDINKLKEDLDKKDIPEILEYKNKYIEFRIKTKYNYFNSFFFQALDETLKELFDFFKDRDENEFEKFETKVVKVNNIDETYLEFKKGISAISIPINFQNEKVLKDESEEKDQNNIIEKGENIKFIENFIKGIHELQKQDEQALCIKNIKQNIKKDESEFRYWFKTYFSAIYEHVEAEPEKGNGRIDLKIVDKNIGTKIIEFKGWWWIKGAKEVVEQLYSYLTDFEDTGYVFMINHLKEKDITNKYKGFLQQDEMKYVDKSWEVFNVNKTSFEYYKSKHKFGNRNKTIFHFIFRVYP